MEIISFMGIFKGPRQSASKAEYNANDDQTGKHFLRNHSHYCISHI